MRTFLQFVNEVSKEDLDKIKKRVKRFNSSKLNDESFNHLFGNKSRIVIPIVEDQEEQDFINFLQENGLENFNFKTGMGEKEVETQKGKKKQTIKIGKFIQSLKSKDSDRWVEWYAKNKTRLEKQDENKNKGVSVIISRHPIDILRMSDHDEWQSCHSPGGSFYKCAFQEAKKGGAIAYVVRNSDLSKIDNLQKSEIFKDDERDIDGIEPLERVRLRKFENSNDEFLVPELRTYGIKHAGFEEAVKNWALSKQKDRIDKMNNSELRPVGGTYFDSSPSEMWKEFVGRKVYVQDDVESNSGITDAQVEEVVRGHDYGHYHVDASVEGADGQDYVHYSAYGRFEFDADDLEDEYKEPKSIDWKLQYELKDQIKSAIDVYTIDYVEFDYSANHFNVNFQVRHTEDNGTLESLEQFLDEIDVYERDYHEHIFKVKLILQRHGILKIKSQEIGLKNLEFHGIDDSNEYVFISQKFEIGKMEGLSTEDFPVSNSGNVYIAVNRNYWASSFSEMVKQKFPHQEIQLKTQMENFTGSVEEFDINKTKNTLHKDGVMYGILEVYLDDEETDNLVKLEEIDGLIPSCVKIVQTQWNEIYKENYNKKSLRIIEQMKLQIFNHYKTGEVYIKNDEYYFRDPLANIDMPVNEFVNLIKKWKDEARNKYRFYFNSGTYVFAIHNGQVVTYWYDPDKNKITPADEIQQNIN